MSDTTLIPPVSPTTFVANLGTFWSGFYSALKRTELEGIASGLTAVWGDIADTIQHTTDALSRSTAPQFGTRRIVSIQLDVNSRLPVPDAYGNGRTYGDGLVYGQGLSGASYAAPENMVFVAYVGNRITTPSRALIYGQDFEISNGRITFVKDPLQDSSWQVTSDASGNQTISMWGWAAKYELQFGYRYGGYTVGIHAENSPRTHELAQAVGDRLAAGATVGRFLNTLGAVVGSPTANLAETVSEIGQDWAGYWVATPTQIYRVPEGATPTVSVGQQLQFGQSLCDGINYAECNQGVAPSWASVLVLTPQLTGGQVSGPIGFLNQVQSLSQVVVSGVRRFRFPIYASPDVAAAFWQQVDADEDATGGAWAKAIQGGGGVFPATINPATAITSTALRRSTAIVGIGATSHPGLWGVIADAINVHSRVLWLVALPDLKDKAVDPTDLPASITDGFTVTDMAAAPADVVTPPYLGEDSC